MPTKVYKLVPAAKVNVIYAERMSPMKKRPKLSMNNGCVFNAKSNAKFAMGGSAEVSTIPRLY
jgi:hypothetical protein